MLAIVLTYVLPIAAAVLGYLAGRTKNKVDDVAARVAADPEVQDLVKRLGNRVAAIRDEVKAAAPKE